MDSHGSEDHGDTREEHEKHHAEPLPGHRAVRAFGLALARKLAGMSTRKDRDHNKPASRQDNYLRPLYCLCPVVSYSRPIHRTRTPYGHVPPDPSDASGQFWGTRRRNTRTGAYPQP